MMFNSVLTTVGASSQWAQPSRGMATLKAIKSRLKAVSSIQKITKSMKMVSAAKYAKAERELRPAKVYGAGAQVFYDRAEVKQDEKKPNHLIVAMTSDRGLCGSAHSTICRTIRNDLPQKAQGANVKIIAVGDKSKAILSRLFKDKILMHLVDIGKKPPVFSDAAFVANHILKSGFEFDVGQLYYNNFKSVVKYRTTVLPIFSREAIENAGKLNVYDSLDEEVLRSYSEFSLATLVYFTMKESACTEQSSRMTAMDSASKNAGEMISKLTLLYNRSRQAVITKELIEIISGASTLQ